MIVCITILFLVVCVISTTLYTISRKTNKHALRTTSKTKKKTRKSKISKLEREVDDALKTIFPTFKFVKTRPQFLKNPATKRNLELDFYCAELKLAFEVNGIQHYKYTPYFHRKGINDFHYQEERDDLKKSLLRKKGVVLITVPFNIDTTAKKYIENRLLGLNRGKTQ